MYNYETEKARLFTEENQKGFLAVRDNVYRLCRLAGCVRLQEAVSKCSISDSWTQLACVDRLVELGEIKEITKGPTMGQHRIFVLVGE